MSTAKRTIGDLPSLSDSLDYLCSYLSSIGLHHITPRTLLLAAEGHPSATFPVWCSLHALICLHLRCPPSLQPRQTQNGHSYFTCRSETSLSSSEEGDCSPEDRLCFIKFYLALWGYPHKSPIFALPNETEESQHLLMALGWLISHCGIFQKAQESRFGTLSPQSSAPNANDVSGSHTAVERRRKARTQTQDYVDKVIAASNKISDSRMRAKARSEQALLLYGRVRMTITRLHAVVSSKAKRIHELNQTQVAHNVQGTDGRPHNQFELHLLEHKQALEHHMATLETHTHKVEHILQCQTRERIFWQWMTAVARHQELSTSTVSPLPSSQPERSELKTISGVCTTHLLPVLKYFQHQLQSTSDAADSPSHTPAPICNVASNHVALLPDDAESASAPGTQGTCGLRCLHEASLLSRGAFILERVTSEEAINAEKVLLRLKMMALSLAEILAQIRAQNRSIIHKILYSSNYKDHLIVGL